MLEMPLCATDMCIYQSPEAEGKTQIYSFCGEVRIVDERLKTTL